MWIHSIIAALLKGGKAGATVILRPTSPLLIAKVLTSVGSKEAFGVELH